MMFILLPLLAILAPCTASEIHVGTVVLDEVTFGKIIPKHDIVLVKFDQMYPWGDHLKEYEKLIAVSNNKQNSGII